MTASDLRPQALVTGATGGMGGAIVRELSRTHDVIAVGRSADALSELAAQTGATPWVLDITDAEALAARTAELTRLDVLVHGAAIAAVHTTETAAPADWERQFGINVFAPAELTRQVLPLLRESQGTVVFIGSGAGTRPVPGHAIYTASKHALRGFADVLRIDEQRHRVRVVTLAPGQTDTGMLRTQSAEMGTPYEPERYIKPSSVAATVRFLVDASPDVHLTDIAVRPRVEIARL